MVDSSIKLSYDDFMKILILLSVTLSLVSCFKPVTRRVMKKNVYKLSLGTPIMPFHSKDMCVKSEDQASYNPASELLISGEKTLKSISSLNSQLFRAPYLLSGEFNLAGRKMVTLEDGVDFSFCKVSDVYEYGSYEDAAVSIMQPISEFEKNHSKFIKKINPEKLELKVLPLMGFDSPKYTGHMINNAFYSPSAKTVVFLPQGFAPGQSTIPFGGTPLWKFPMVMMHEYGHHIFSTVSSKIYSDDYDHELCFDNRNINDISSQTKGDKREIDKHDALGALNEGFADIFAFYAQKDKSQLVNMGCMTESRDVKFDTFLSGDKKEISERVLADFISSTDIDYGLCYKETNYQDIHIIGAVYARAWYELLDEPGERGNQRELKDQDKLIIISNWAKKIGRSYYIDNTGSTVKEFLKISAELMTKAASKINKDKSCRVLEKYFPAFEFNSCI